MRKQFIRLDIKANDPVWLYEQYIVLGRGKKDIASECKTTEDSITYRLKKFNIEIRDHKTALNIRNKKYTTIKTDNKYSTKYRYTRDYKNFRTTVLTRDDYRCTFCGCKDKLHVHHIKRVVDFPDLVYDIENGITLCKRCHDKIHSSPNK